MYFPYLYARRAERAALVDVAPYLGSIQQVVHPIIEPYSRAEDLEKVLDAFQSAGESVHVIVNPTRGALNSSKEQATWSTKMSVHIAQPALVTPTLSVTGRTAAQEIATFLSDFDDRKVAVVVQEGGLPPSTLANLLHDRPTTVFVAPGLPVPAYDAALGIQTVVPLMERFKVIRNADYPSESWFSEDPNSWTLGGRRGYGDFTILKPTPPSGTGGGAGAVAVHLTYQDPATRDLLIQHFLSDDQVQRTVPDAIKLLQALDHMHTEQSIPPGRFLPSPGYAALEDVRASRRSTNLETSKRCQIAHHLFAVAKALGA